MTPRRRAVLGLVLGLGLASTTLTGCTAARNGLGTHASSCFRILPEAHAAAGKNSRFDGVLSTSAVVLVEAVGREPHSGPPPVPPAPLAATSHEMTCLVRFRGVFSLSTVSRGWAPGPGPYWNAIVVVRQPTADVVATVLFRRIPLSIRFSDGST
jgi:hypothetical protein